MKRVDLQISNCGECPYCKLGDLTMGNLSGTFLYCDRRLQAGTEHIKEGDEMPSSEFVSYAVAATIEDTQSFPWWCPLAELDAKVETEENA